MAAHDTAADATQVGGNHYKQMPVQPWTVMEQVLSPAEFRGYLKGNIIKYSMRAGHKTGASDDAEKAQHYKAKLAEFNAARRALFSDTRGGEA